MNLSPQWREVLSREGHDAEHWSEVGDPGAPDRELMAYAIRGGHVVFTHDMGFSAMLAATAARAPSILQVRAQDALSEEFRDLVLRSLRRFERELRSGAIVVVEEYRARVRILPLPSEGS